MGEFLTDDIDSLLKSGHGDAIRLSKIRADFEATKLVSIEDRKYVEGLLLRYSQSTEKKSEKSLQSKRVAPPPTPRISQPLFEARQQVKQEQKIVKPTSRTKFRKIAIAACATIMAVVAISIFAMNQDIGIGSVIVSGKSLEFDSSSYANGDIISVYGKTSSSTQAVNLTISNPLGVQIFSEPVAVKPNGSFSTLIIAGGPGWEQYGKYTVTVNYSQVKETATFNFIQN